MSTETDDKETLKIPALTNMTEMEYYRSLYRKAGDAMLNDFSQANIKAYEAAQNKLQEVEDLYREGYQLLLAKSRGLQRL